ncbi:MAG: 1-deoxy-D-xylulose-5-phosphate synthase [Synergistaceae bacterium]|nr:1-deoxy-D-xylulose-5-phosphate synthase [Synergistaceae bacterium]MBP9626249.1 1-deoxy-D-xylulose-5-phosphate synthase [Synergistaceae bacterium]MBP9957476.1 1-deoxy-D-xylulose-5-phosphate synthase [Synergistaceae bacterium]
MDGKKNISQEHSLLKSVRDFRGLKRLDLNQLPQLSEEIRELIIDVTLRNGGHLGGSLGTVELCIALLRAFDPDRDKIIFDVGHQAYAYKILTDRLERFGTLRTKGGISGFPRRSESPYDFFDVGHSSTSISAALGYAKARDLTGQKHDVVAVIGDGALLNGLALEALNNVCSTESKVVIILNDNGMSISPGVGGMAEHLAKLSVNSNYKRFKQFIKDQCRVFQNSRQVEGVLERIKTKMKSLLLPTNIFEAMGINYWGPFDGHDTQEMEEIFELSKQYPSSLVIHVITKKGKGCHEAECSPTVYHGVGGGTVLSKVSTKSDKPKPDDWSKAVANVLLEMAGKDHRIMAGTAAMIEGTKLTEFRRRFPRRFFDVGIAEGHMFTYAAGLAAGGMRPVVCVYSTFLQRAMDQLVHDICLQKLPVLICVDRAGLAGEDGDTHQGLLDIAWGRSIPGLIMGSPRDQVDLKFMISEWLDRNHPVLIRYPKGEAPAAIMREESHTPALWGRAEILQDGTSVCLVALGSTVALCLKVSLECVENNVPEPGLVDLRFSSPIDFKTIDVLLGQYDTLIVVEEGYLSGGVGEAIAARAGANQSPCKVITLGVPDVYVPHATRQEQLESYGFTVDQVAQRVKECHGASPQTIG